MYVVEYQKRGLPHAHLLVILAESDRLLTAADIDRAVCAELPPSPTTFSDAAQRKQATSLENFVLKCMVHGSCGEMNRSSPCMADGKCSKGYPRPFEEVTSWTETSLYPKYRRRNMRTATVGNFVIDNRWIVPYNPYLSLKFQAPINVEAWVSPFAAKYLFLYINKVLFVFFIGKNFF